MASVLLVRFARAESHVALAVKSVSVCLCRFVRVPIPYPRSSYHMVSVAPARSSVSLDLSVFAVLLSMNMWRVPHEKQGNAA